MGSIPLTIVLTVDSVEMINALEEDTYREGMLRNRVISEHITQLCEKNFHVLHTLALNPDLRRYTLQPSPTKKLQIAELLHNTNNIFNDRNLMAVTASNGFQLMRTDGSDLVNVITREHFHEAMKGRDYVSDIIVSRSTGKMIVVMEVPIRNGHGEPIGMLQRNLNVSELQHFVKELSSNDINLVITDRDGRIIADSAKVFDSPVEYINDGSYNEVSEKIQADNKPSGIFSVSINGEDYLISYSRNYATGWLVFVVKPYQYIWNEVLFKILRSILIALAMFTTVAIIAKKLAHTATKPIIDITHAADKIAHGNNVTDKL